MTKTWVATIAILASVLACKVDPAPGDESVAFTHVTVIDVTGEPPRRDMTLVVAGDRITALGKTGSVSLPEKVRVIDATGKFLIPGLWDMHLHTLQSITSAGRSFDVHDTFFPLFVANGITGVRDTNGDLGILARVRQHIREGKLRGPTIVAAGPVVDGASWPFGSIAVKSDIEGRSAVRFLNERGADFVKVGSLVPRDAYFAVADEAKRQQMPFAGHVPFSVTAREASDAGQKSIEHLDGLMLGCSPFEPALREEMQKKFARGSFSDLWLVRVQAEAKALETYDDRLAVQLISRFVNNKTWQVPTLVLKRATASIRDKAFADDSRLAYIPGFLMDTWGDDNPLTGGYSAEDFANEKRVFAKQLALIRKMHQAGVKFMAGTDTIDPFIFPGFSLHDELALLVEAGLTPLDALQTATRNPAEYLGISESVGTVTAGKVADLVLLDADPLADIRNTQRIWAVVLRGELLDRQALDKILASSKAAASRGGT